MYTLSWNEKEIGQGAKGSDHLRKQELKVSQIQSSNQ
jgi:hypothetical protein